MSWGRLVAAVLVVVLASGGVAMASGTDTMSIGAMYPTNTTSGVGGNLWTSGGSAVPGAPANSAGCAPAIQQAHGNAYAAGVRNAMTMSQRQPPGKIMTACVTNLINLLSALDIFSNSGPWSMAALLDAVVRYAEGLVCDVIAEQFNKVVGMAFNQVAFLADMVPCGVGVNLSGLGTGSGGMNFCDAIGGPLISVGNGTTGTFYTLGSPTPIPGVMGGGSGSLGNFTSNPLGNLLKN